MSKLNEHLSKYLNDHLNRHFNRPNSISLYLSDLVKDMMKSPNGKKVIGLYVILFLMAGKSVYSKKRDIKNLMRIIPNNLNISDNQNTKMKKPTIMDYIKILVTCQKEDKKVYPFIILYTIILVSRIIVTARLTGKIARVAKHLAKRDWNKMFNAQYEFALACIPSMLLTGFQNFLERIVETRIFTSLANSMSKSYFSDNRFYKITDLHMDSVITHDTSGFSRELMQSFNGVVKPSVDIIYLSFILAKKIGFSNVAKFYGYFGIVSLLLSYIKLPFSKLIKHKMSLEADFRSNMHRTSEYIEPIAFLKGGPTEADISNKKLMTMKRYSNKLALYKIIPDMLDAYFIKYGGMMIGFMTMVPPIYSASYKGDSADITEYYILMSNLMVTVGKTIIELISAQKSVYNLDGFTSRISDALLALKTVETKTNVFTDIFKNENISLHNVDISVPIKKTSHMEDTTDNKITNDIDDKSHQCQKRLIKGLTLNIKKNENLVIIGNNGTGKTSLFRALAGLWNSSNYSSKHSDSGVIIVPEKIKFIPQKPYFTIDTLYRSVAYPNTNITQDVIKSIDDLILKVGLVNVVNRYTVLTPVDWTSCLSGGEKQRLAFVRALYDNPEYCIMDEATSAISADIEEKIFEICLERGVTIVSIVHKDSLKKFHKRELKLLGDGVWTCDNLSK
jgi:ABC-type uncharacterized transport system fused permease/ATPase subunit